MLANLFIPTPQFFGCPCRSFGLNVTYTFLSRRKSRQPLRRQAGIVRPLGCSSRLVASRAIDINRIAVQDPGCLQFSNQSDRRAAGGDAPDGAAARLESHACDLRPERHDFPKERQERSRAAWFAAEGCGRILANAATDRRELR